MSVFRLTFDDDEQFDIEVHPRSLGPHERMVTAAVYRCVGGERELTPLLSADGERLVFAASSEDEAFELACSMLKTVHTAALRSLGRPRS
jgi:hypothetical protein